MLCVLQRPFFEVDVQLAIPDVKLSPDPSDVQLAMNRCAVAVINCNKRLWDWGQEDLPVLLHRFPLPVLLLQLRPSFASAPQHLPLSPLPLPSMGVRVHILLRIVLCTQTCLRFSLPLVYVHSRRTLASPSCVCAPKPVSASHFALYMCTPGGLSRLVL
jgi:hypothetical protein